MLLLLMMNGVQFAFVPSECSLKKQWQQQQQKKNKEFCLIKYLLTQINHLANVIVNGTKNHFADLDLCLDSIHR